MNDVQPAAKEVISVKFPSKGGGELTDILEQVISRLLHCYVKVPAPAKWSDRGFDAMTFPTDHPNADGTFGAIGICDRNAISNE